MADDVTGKPAFGWAAFGHGPGRHLHAASSNRDGIRPDAVGRSHDCPPATWRLAPPGEHIGGITFKAASPVKLAGYPGRQFDGNVWGIYGHTFVPFSPKTGGASPADSFHLEKGESFRLVALNVNSKTVVLLYDNVALPAERFPAFIASADRLLRSLTFHA